MITFLSTPSKPFGFLILIYKEKYVYIFLNSSYIVLVLYHIITGYYKELTIYCTRTSTFFTNKIVLIFYNIYILY